MSRLQKSGLLLLLVLLLAAAGAGVYLGNKPAAPAQRIALSIDSTACKDGEGLCRASTPTLGELRLRFPDGAYYMQAFSAELSISDKTAVEAVKLELTMRGMDMGRNHFVLQLAAPGQWQGELLLPICVTGRVDWQVEVRMKRAGTEYIAAFPLTVKQPTKQ